MSDYREESNKAKAVRRGIDDAKTTKLSKKKPKVKGPWKVIGTLFSDKPYIWHHCATKELAEKMMRKHQSLRATMRIEYVDDNKAPHL